VLRALRINGLLGQRALITIERNKNSLEEVLEVIINALSSVLAIILIIIILVIIVYCIYIYIGFTTKRLITA